MKISEIKNALNLIEENKNLRSVKDFRMISATKFLIKQEETLTKTKKNTPFFLQTTILALPTKKA